MYARIIRSSHLDHLDEGMAALRQRVIPLVHDEDGYISLSVSYDPSTTAGTVVTLWETRHDMVRSDASLGGARSAVARAFGIESMAIHAYEVLASAQSSHGVGPGCWVRSMRIQVDPGGLEPLVDDFRNEALPTIRSLPGHRGAFVFADRATGEAIVSVVWADEHAMKSAEDVTAGRRDDLLVLHRAEVREVGHRHILMVDAPD